MKATIVVHLKRLMLSLGLALMGSALATAQPTGCGPYPGCLYVPPASYPVELTTGVVTYSDVTGSQRSVPLAIRRPVGKPGPLPVVIWVHGGGDGHSNPVISMDEWSTTTAQAGYLSVAGAHTQRQGTSHDNLCNSLGVSPPDCPEFQSLNWDRPKDVSAIIDHLAAMNTQLGPLNSKIDMGRIAVGGHSAGSAAALSVAGASRLLVGNVGWNLSDPRPVAFLALSPQGPGNLGFFDSDFRQPLTSWAGIARPVLIATGDGDARCDGPSRDLCSVTPMLRRIAFERLRPGEKYLMYIRHAATFHHMFALKTSACPEKNVDPSACSAFASWLQSSALAFLDFHVEGRAAGQIWLRSPFLKIASGGVTDIETK